MKKEIIILSPYLLSLGVLVLIQTQTKLPHLLKPVGEASINTAEMVRQREYRDENQQVKIPYQKLFHILLDYDNENYAERNEEILTTLLVKRFKS